MATTTRCLLMSKSLTHGARAIQHANGIDHTHHPNYNAPMVEKVAVQPAEYARIAVDVASEGQASDILLLDLAGVSDIADYFVILTAESARQMRAVADDIERALELVGATLHHREGTHQSGWMLLDYVDVIVHLLGTEEREFYQIEEAWSQAVEVVRIQ